MEVRLDLSTRVARGAGNRDVDRSLATPARGSPKEKLGDIFEKFTQADSSITRKYGGTGLGLAYHAPASVEIHGGRIRVESEVGKGSSFFVTIAFDPAPLTEPAPRVEAKQADQPSTGVRLLLVEDNLVNQKVVLAMLRKRGYQIDIAKRRAGGAG